MFQNPEETYCIAHSTAQSKLLADLERVTFLRSAYPHMISGALQGRVLAMISKLVKPLRVLEIGTFTGYSALCLCEGLQPGGSVITIDNNPEIELIAKSYFSQSLWKDQIELKIGDAVTILPTLNQGFDLIFIDADKENYPVYYALAVSLLNSGGLMLVDNVLWGGKVLQPAVHHDKETRGVLSFNQLLVNDSAMEVVMIPLRDGLTMARKVS
ncbi:MAG: methyltransferase [Bacteroidetes bacterium HGW-Bacteroidetes-22]|nr:MAG: methyltransferase [Bacteroidetes bacterium HGW-Bacteroidetes-22]